MAFQTNNQFNANQYSKTNSGGGAGGKKTNFAIRTIWGVDGRLDVTIWMSDTGPKVIVSIKQYVGKDPDRGTNIVEQKMPNELPNLYLNPRYVRALHQFMENADPTALAGTLEFKKNDQVQKSMVFSSENGKAVITLNSDTKGQRKITFETVNFGGNLFHSDWEEFKAAIKICLDKITTIKMDSYEELNPSTHTAETTTNGEF